MLPAAPTWPLIEMTSRYSRFVSGKDSWDEIAVCNWSIWPWRKACFFFSSPVETALLVPTFLGLALPWPFLAGEKASFGLVDLGNSCFWDLDDPNSSKAKREVSKTTHLICLIASKCLRDLNNPVCCWNHHFIFPWKKKTLSFLSLLVFLQASFRISSAVHLESFIDLTTNRRLHPRL